MMAEFCVDFEVGDDAAESPRNPAGRHDRKYPAHASRTVSSRSMLRCSRDRMSMIMVAIHARAGQCLDDTIVGDIAGGSRRGRSSAVAELQACSVSPLRACRLCGNLGRRRRHRCFTKGTHYDPIQARWPALRHPENSRRQCCRPDRVPAKCSRSRRRGPLRRADEMRIGDSMLLISDGGGARDARPGFLLCSTFRTLDETYQRAIAAGAELIETPADTPYETGERWFEMPGKGSGRSRPTAKVRPTSPGHSQIAIYLRPVERALDRHDWPWVYTRETGKHPRNADRSNQAQQVLELRAAT